MVVGGQSVHGVGLSRDSTVSGLTTVADTMHVFAERVIGSVVGLMNLVVINQAFSYWEVVVKVHTEHEHLLMNLRLIS